jgi:hypothetical protein
VTSPNGGESWTAETAHTITWTYTGSPGTYVKIELYKGGVLNRAIASSVLTSSGTYNWSIASTQVPGSDYTVKVTSTTNGAYTDTSNGNFTIVGPPPPTITVTSPNGGETWSAGSLYQIKWTYTGNPGAYVKIELLKGGVLNRTISTMASIGSGGTGSFNWTVPSTQTPGNDYTVRVTSTTVATCTDTSDANFNIAGPALTVTAPNGGETWSAGSLYQIKWTYTGNPGAYVRAIPHWAYALRQL